MSSTAATMGRVQFPLAQGRSDTVLEKILRVTGSPLSLLKDSFRHEQIELPVRTEPLAKVDLSRLPESTVREIREAVATINSLAKLMETMVKVNGSDTKLMPMFNAVQRIASESGRNPERNAVVCAVARICDSAGVMDHKTRNHVVLFASLAIISDLPFSGRDMVTKYIRPTLGLR